MLEPRKKCKKCNEFLIVFQGHYLHPDTVCNGVKDAVHIEAEIEDEFLYKKFKNMYGKPKIDDYDRITTLDGELRVLKEERKVLMEKLIVKEVMLNHPIIRLIIKLFKLQPKT